MAVSSFLAKAQSMVQVMGHQNVFKAGAEGSSRMAWIEVQRPLNIVCLNKSITTQLGSPTANAASLVCDQQQLAIGTDVKSITCVEDDFPYWAVSSFKWGTLEFVQGSEPVNLSSFSTHLAHVDRIAPMILSKTVQQVTIDATLVQTGFDVSSGAVIDAAIFRGFNIAVISEETICAITNRIAPTNRQLGNLAIIQNLQHMYNHVLGVPLTPMYMQPHAATGGVQAPPGLYVGSGKPLY